MKIAVDLTYIGAEYNFGLANFAFKLLAGMRENGISDSVILLVEEGCEKFFAHRIEGFRTIPLRCLRFFPMLPFTRGMIYRRQLDGILEREGVSLLLSTYIDDRSLYTSRIPWIGVIHDTYRFYRSNPLRTARFRFGAFRLCNMMERIVAISEDVRTDIGRFKSIRTQVEVIPVSIVSTADPDSRQVCNPPYILDVNTMVEHKNPLTLVKAFESICMKIPHNLIFKGSRNDYWKGVIEPYLKGHGLEGRVLLNDTPLTQEEIDTLYVNADLFVTPSEMEGFGATPIEAAMARVPVICNRLPALLESTRGLVNYYSPSRDWEALAGKILEVLEKRDEERLEAIRAEYARAYSPKSQALQFMELICRISGGSF